MLEEGFYSAHRRAKHESRHINLERHVSNGASIVKNKSIRISHYGQRFHSIVWVLLGKLSSKALYRRHESES